MITRRLNDHVNRVVKVFNWLMLLTVFNILPTSFTALSPSVNQRQLKLVHIIFGHKLYAPLKTNTRYVFSEKLDYQYFLANGNEMPNEAKLEMFKLGEFLRSTYDNFLGDLYFPEIMEMRTNEYDLSMISGLLVNAGLWPPAELQKWNQDLNWQPISTEYVPMENDTLFLGTLCQHFIKEQEIILTNDESVINEISVHKPLFSYISNNLQQLIQHPTEISLIYSTLETIASNQTGSNVLPKWAQDIFPHGEMWNVSLLAYHLLSKSTTQKQLNGGTFLKRIIQQSKINYNTNDTSAVYNDSQKLKISMYSGEERNVIGVLEAMNLWWSPHLPENGASIIFEFLYDKSSDLHGFEIFYYTGVEDNETIPLTLPGCTKFCPLNDFTRLLSTVIPADENILCHSEPSIKKQQENDAESSGYSNHIYQKNLYLNYTIFLLSSVLSTLYINILSSTIIY